MKFFKKILWLLLVVFVVAQFFRPDKNEGDLASLEPFLSETKPSENVAIILKEACYDCHSSVTRYPWYSHITPVNYWMDGHVKHGKGNLDFSKWSDYSIKRKDHKLEELIEMVEAKTMPLESYTLMHGEAKLSDAQIKELVDWAQQVRFSYSLLPKPE
ncbi:MAG TPA: heme-binding domain-containing protein [Flavobacteriaceae bacterium]|nr:heme-binding domain-containing protein [Flavobacteriaceae bacterium]